MLIYFILITYEIDRYLSIFYDIYLCINIIIIIFRKLYRIAENYYLHDHVECIVLIFKDTCIIKNLDFLKNILFVNFTGFLCCIFNLEFFYKYKNVPITIIFGSFDIRCNIICLY